MFEHVVYHATDLNKAKIIEQSAFKCSESDELWLGKGIYFFDDIAIAKWWISNRPEKFGGSMQDGVILAPIIRTGEKSVFDCTKVKGARELAAFFKEETVKMQSVCNNTCASLSKKQLTCLLFNRFKAEKERENQPISVMIANFEVDNSDYLENDEASILYETAHIKFYEKQYCVSPNVLFNIHIMEGCIVNEKEK